MQMYFRDDLNYKIARNLYMKYSPIMNLNDLQYLVNDIDKSYLESIRKYNLSNREILNSFIKSFYPNETIIKATFINKVICKTKNQVSIFELNVEKSRVDLCKITNISTAFEIKSEFDTTQRLNQQMEDYFKVFEKVYLICPADKLVTYLSFIPVKSGIYVYKRTANGKFIYKKVRNAIRSEEISSYSQLMMLTLKELKFYFDCKLTDREDMIQQILISNSKSTINRRFKKILSNRYKEKWDFLISNKNEILDIDYQWFFKNSLSPEVVYQ